MGLLYCEGFEQFGPSAGSTQDGVEEKYTSSSNVSGATVEAGRIEGLSLRLGSNGFLKPDGVLSGDEMTFGFGYRRHSGTATIAFFRVYFNSLPTALWDLQQTNGGNLILRHQIAAQATATGGLPNDSDWHYLHFHIKIHPSTGFVKVYVDDVIQISLTGIDTTGEVPEGPATELTRFALASASSCEVEFDDFFCYTGELLQDSVINTLFPTADGANSDFTPDTGSDNYARVDERPMDADTSYVESSTSGHTDTYSFDTLASTAINGIQVNAFMRSTSGSANMRCVARVGGVDYPAGSATSVSTSYRNVRQILDENPDTSLPWQSSELNAGEYGFKVG